MCPTDIPAFKGIWKFNHLSFSESSVFWDKHKAKNISDKNVTTVFYKTLGIIFSALQNYCPYLYRVNMRNAVTILGHVKQI